MAFLPVLNLNNVAQRLQNETKTKPSLSLYSPYYAEACNEFTVPISAS